MFSEHKIHIHSVDYEKDQAKGELIYNFSISTRNKSAIKDMFLKLGALEFVKTVKIDSRDKLLF